MLTVTSWRETATLIAAGASAEPVEWLEDSSYLVVDRPWPLANETFDDERLPPARDAFDLGRAAKAS